ncbi:MAG: hypothetical protein ACI9K5_001915, partial [Gammaproteobacteria bacterium]
TEIPNFTGPAMFIESRIVTKPPTEPVVSVDGAALGPGLHLSHWPGNRTPRELRHDLSTGIALGFIGLPRGRQVELAAGAHVVVNNHFDTDGCCAAFVLMNPRVAPALSEQLLAIAACGDFFSLPDERAFCADRIISAMADPVRSPIRERFSGLGDAQRWTLAQDEVLRILPQLCAGQLEPFRVLWETDLMRLRTDRRLLATCDKHQLSTRDWTCWNDTLVRTPGDAPGRHAMFGSSDSDRVLYLASAVASPAAAGTELVTEQVTGTIARLVISTLSWFDLVSPARHARPNLEELVQKLNDLEEADPTDSLAWRAQSLTNASPELWFGGAQLEAFAEHNAALGVSSLRADTIKEVIGTALAPPARATAR